eukprot:TRINITY_DN71778_c0_g1_i1.p1 TRINITY_DN71778_c0_g1~~TRINITY_DN71778_c0_g1_i1.p1  ORF type:complete len:248 (+),score=30.13 TRINITY_DN71778_c0_g1_i1:14-757(+)
MLRLSFVMSEPESDEETYEVERVVNHYVDHRKRVQYELKWKNYASSENTWEKEKDIFAKELIEEYWKRRDPDGSFRQRHGIKMNHATPPPEASHSSSRLPKLEISDDENDEEPEPASRSKVPTPQSKVKATPSKTRPVASSSLGRQTPRTPTNVPNPKPISVDDSSTSEDEGEWMTDSEVRAKLASKSWEQDAKCIDTVERGDDGTLYGVVLWKNGKLSKHLTSTINEKCPHKMLAFYEAHVRFKAI